MQKQEIIALIERLYSDQEKYNKFITYAQDFFEHRRCKKGILSFVEELFNLPEIAGKDQLAIELLTDKTRVNSDKGRFFVMNHPITVGYNTALIEARIVVLKAVADYIVQTAERIQESGLDDKIERQVYLRRAIARLITLTQSAPNTPVKLDQWHEVEPRPWIDYLTSTFDEMLGFIDKPEQMRKWSDTGWSENNMDNLDVIRSLISYLDYMDSFTEF